MGGRWTIERRRSAPAIVGMGVHDVKNSALRIEEVTEPEVINAARVRAEQGRGNANWLESHWSDLLPRARGKFIAVAGGEGFVAETVQAAWNWVNENHSGDGGAFVQYFPCVRGPASMRIIGPGVHAMTEGPLHVRPSMPPRAMILNLSVCMGKDL